MKDRNGRRNGKRRRRRGNKRLRLVAVCAATLLVMIGSVRVCMAAFGEIVWVKAAPEAVAAAAGNGPAQAETHGAEKQDGQEDWRLMLVNKWNSLPEDFSVKLTTLANGHAVDERAYPDLQAMMDTARAEGLSPVICSSYRTQEKQQGLFDAQVNKNMAQGDTRAEAERKAGEWVAVPGTSEHQTGLAVDIVSLDYQLLDENQEKTPEQKWLMEHSWEYGFILRYPTDKSGITGIGYEPWHYRYVGKVAAKEITEKGLCLEEYLQGQEPFAPEGI